MSALDKKQSDQERALSRRKQVLDAAESCFTRSGFHGASMAEISKAAGMSIGHIYNYFDGKDAIIGAFVQMNVERVSEMMEEMAKRSDILQALLDNVEHSVYRDQQPGVWKLPLEIFAEASRNPAIAAVVQAADKISREQLRALLVKGRTDRGLPTEAGMIDGRIEAIISLFQGLRIRTLHNPTLDLDAVAVAFRMALTPLLFNP